ncbi:hypothetical protein ACIQTN_29800 [Streptomyces werraensis]|uniref:hypothetical protein n=1 Tax=Streptomyces werraensis TaxID=68284 RepID=UPI00380EE04B
MTWGRRARIALYAVAFTWLGWHAAAALFAGVWPVAAALYALALVFAVAAYAEWSTAAAYADAVDAGLATRPTSRAHARRLAARVLAGTCRCDRWWTSFGTDHDPWCPVQTGDAPRAHTPHPRRRPVPGRRAVAAARHRRRHRPR